MDDDALVIWVVFDHPPDFPRHFVARKQFTRAGEIYATHEALFAQTLPQLHAKLPPGLVCMPRHPMDEQHIVEFWL